MCVSDERDRAVVGFYRVLNRPVPGPDRLRLRGLDPGRSYRVTLWPLTGDGLERANTRVRGGDDLMANGLLLAASKEEVAARGDAWARVFVLDAV